MISLAEFADTEIALLKADHQAKVEAIKAQLLAPVPPVTSDESRGKSPYDPKSYPNDGREVSFDG